MPANDEYGPLGARQTVDRQWLLVRPTQADHQGDLSEGCRCLIIYYSMYTCM